MRVFVAIDLPVHVRAELVALQNEIVVGRLVPAENLHFTLSFLGEQSDEAIEDAHYALSGIRAASFPLQLAGVGSFGSRSPHIVYADVARSRELADLEKRMTRALRTAGLAFQKRRFRPHVTLARLPKHLPGFELARLRDFLAEHAAFRGSCFDVNSFRFCRSLLRPGGAVYETLERYALAGAEEGRD